MNERAPESGGNWDDLRGDRGSPLGDRDALVEAARRQTRAADELGQRLLTYTRVIAGLTVVLCLLTIVLPWPELSKLTQLLRELNLIGSAR
jgi:hypothetical protein